MAASRALYNDMARTIHEQQKDAAPTTRLEIAGLVKALCSDLKTDNRNFQADKFVQACGLSDLIREMGH